MIYAVVVKGEASREERLAAALGGGALPIRHVYVVALSNGSALANALGNVAFTELDDPDAAQVAQFTYSELIGNECEFILQQAKNRAAQLQKDDNSFLTRAVEVRQRLGI